MEKPDASTSGSIRATYLATEYRHEASGWGLYLLKGQGESPIMACGSISREPIVGETVTVNGRWSRFESRGKVFSFDDLRAVAPRNPAFFVDYLAAIGDIPSATAAMIVDAFAKDTLLVLSRSPERISEIQGVSAAHRERLLANWRERRQLDHLEDELNNSGLNPNLLIELSYRLPPELSVKEMLSEDPWLIYLYSKTPFYLVRDFVTSTGSVDSGHYLEAGIVATARRALMQGKHSVPLDLVKRQIPALLGSKKPINDDALNSAIEWLSDEQLAHKSEDGSITLTEFSEDRDAILKKLAAINNAENEVTDQLTLTQIEKILRSAEETAVLVPHTAALLSFLQTKAYVVQACHPTLADIFETLIDVMTDKLHFEVTKIHAGFVAADAKQQLSLNYLGRSGFGPPEKGNHDPIDADIVVVFEAHLLTTEDLKDILTACETESVIIFVGNVFSRSLHVTGAPMDDLRDFLPVLNLDALLTDTNQVSITQILDVAAGRWMPPADEADLDFNQALIPIECADSEIAAVVSDVCFGELMDALSLNPAEDSQIVIPRPKNKETLILLKGVESSYAESLTKAWEGKNIYRGILRASVSRLDLPIYLTGTVHIKESGDTDFHAGSKILRLYEGETKHLGVAYLAQMAHAQQIRRPLIIVIVPSTETISNEDLLCAMGCSTAWTFLVGSPSNIESKNLESDYGL